MKEYLTTLKTVKVEVLIPKKGDKLKLVQMIENNIKIKEEPKSLRKSPTLKRVRKKVRIGSLNLPVIPVLSDSPQPPNQTEQKQIRKSINITQDDINKSMFQSDLETQQSLSQIQTTYNKQPTFCKMADLWLLQQRQYMVLEEMLSMMEFMRQLIHLLTRLKISHPTSLLI